MNSPSWCKWCQCALGHAGEPPRNSCERCEKTFAEGVAMEREACLDVLRSAIMEKLQQRDVNCARVLERQFDTLRARSEAAESAAAARARFGFPPSTQEQQEQTFTENLDAFTLCAAPKCTTCGGPHDVASGSHCPPHPEPVALGMRQMTDAERADYQRFVESQFRPDPVELDLTLLSKFASGEGGQRTGALMRAGLLNPTRVRDTSGDALETDASPEVDVMEKLAPAEDSSGPTPAT